MNLTDEQRLEWSCRMRFEGEFASRSQSVRHLHEIGCTDPTVHAYLAQWLSGHFSSFEGMLTQLAVQLATEKAEYIKVAEKVIHAG